MQSARRSANVTQGTGSHVPPGGVHRSPHPLCLGPAPLALEHGQWNAEGPPWTHRQPDLGGGAPLPASSQPAASAGRPTGSLGRAGALPTTLLRLTAPPPCLLPLLNPPQPGSSGCPPDSHLRPRHLGLPLCWFPSLPLSSPVFHLHRPHRLPASGLARRVHCPPAGCSAQPPGPPRRPFAGSRRPDQGLSPPPTGTRPHLRDPRGEPGPPHSACRAGALPAFGISCPSLHSSSAQSLPTPPPGLACQTPSLIDA